MKKKKIKIKKEKKKREIKKQIIIILLALILIVGGMSLLIYRQNIFGRDRVRFEITAPDQAEAGERINYRVSYRNNSNVRLEDVTLVFEYPEQSIPIEGEMGDIIKRGEFRREVNIGEINPGEEKRAVFSARLLGQEGEPLYASAWLYYRPKNLTTRYQESRDRETIISGVPLDLEWDLPKTVRPEEEANFRLRYSSDAQIQLEDLEIRAEYPSKFQFLQSAPPSGAEENNRWEIALLSPGEGGTVDINGFLEDDPGEIKRFGADLGIWLGDNFVVLKENVGGVTEITDRELLLYLQVNGQEEYIANPGEELFYEIFFKNLGENTLENLTIRAELDSRTLDLGNVDPMDGSLQSHAGLILWSHTQERNRHLRSLRPEEEGTVKFFAPVRKDNLPLNPETTVKVITDVTESITVKINTRFELSQEATPKEASLFGPEANEYEVRWNMESLFADARDVKISAFLPQNAKITEKTIPAGSNLEFNSSSGEITLEMEKLSAQEKKEIVFNVELPEGEKMEELISEAVMRGTDTNTKEEITQTAPAVILDENED